MSEKSKNTPTAEQQAIAPESGAVYAELPAPTASIGIDDAWHEPAMRDFADRTHALRMQAAPKAAPGEPFQHRVQPWLLQCFGAEIAADTVERNHRFLEEALELVQSTGCTQSEAHQLVDYAFGRPVGEPAQEVGGVMVTLAALCLANGLDMHNAGEIELARIWTKVEAIRAKQAEKPKHSPLPQAAPQQEAQEPAAYIHVPHHTVEGQVRPVVSFEKYQQDYADGIYSTRIPLYTAPQPAPAPLSEMPYEKRKAIQEGEQIGASDAWFKARHEMLDTVDRRNVFRAGFDRGWNAALAAQGDTP